MFYTFIFLPLLIGRIVTSSGSSNSFALTFDLEHSLSSSGEVGVFSKRAKIHVSSDDESTVKFSDNIELNEQQILSLEKMIQNNEMYTLRVAASSQGLENRYVMTSIPSCYLAKSNFMESISLHLADNGELIAMELKSPNIYEEHCDFKGKLPRDVVFESSGMVISSHKPPVIPQTTDVRTEAPPGVKKTKKDSENDPEETKSFFQRYWYIILAVVLFSMLGGDANAQNQQGAAAAPTGNRQR